MILTTGTVRREPVVAGHPSADEMVDPARGAFEVDLASFERPRALETPEEASRYFAALEGLAVGQPRRWTAGFPLPWLKFQHYPEASERVWIARLDLLRLAFSLGLVIALVAVGRTAFLKGRARRAAERSTGARP